ncbi:MAG: LPS export ABC transporter periplasmic protein LptC [Gammaproteobacteria bacterium]|nr:LPS export ABC transporter periplasmic protein LptC [Gammaproteobacteria bacterium]MDH5613989.1 LPS export ABC transporter periplasmic protein LptC [Gammaproteobacteria bacterium]
MTVTARRILAILLIIIVSGLSGLFLDSVTPDKEKEEKKLRHDPDYYVIDFTVTTMGENGKPKHLLVAERMNHYPDDDTTELLKPHMEIYRIKEPAWHIDSNRGWVSSDGKLVLLLGKVHIRRKGSKTNEPVNLWTEELRFHPDDEYAETDKHVKIKNGNSITEATGMRAWLGEGRIQFLSRTRGSYESAN